MLSRYLFDEHGKVRRRPMTITVAVLILIAGGGAALGGLAALWSDNPNLQGAWVVATVMLAKIPLLLFALWWIFRAAELPGHPVKWDEQETQEILEYLRRESLRALDQPDSAQRLEYLRKEAWHVADRSNGAAKSDAVSVALEIDRLNSRSGRRVVEPPASR